MVELCTAVERKGVSGYQAEFLENQLKVKERLKTLSGELNNASTYFIRKSCDVPAPFLKES
jgi:hypothetical protein